MRHARHRGRQQRYRLTFEASLAVALALCIAAFRSGWDASAGASRVTPEPEPLTLVEPPAATQQPEKAPPPLRPLVPLLVPDDVELPEGDDIDFQMSEIDVQRPAPVGPPPPGLAGDDEERAEPFERAEQMPAPRDGWAAFYGALTYPKAARRAGVEGRVVLEFVVDKDGQVREVDVLESAHPLLDEEAARALRRVQFAPGRQRDRPVPVRMRLPVAFRLGR